MQLKKAAFLDLASVYRGDLDLSALKEAVPEWLWFDNITAEQMRTSLDDVDVIVSNKVELDEVFLQSHPKLKLICIAATGLNNIDLEAAEKYSVSVRNVEAYATPSVVQHVFSLLLSLTTRAAKYQQAVKDGAWAKSEHFCLLDYPIRELSGKTIGIVGFGELGQAVANVAQAFGMRVLVAKRDSGDKRENRVDLHEMLKLVDVLSLHCPLTSSNRHLIGKKEFALMKSDAVLINTARGGLIDEPALLEALHGKRLAGAALDVLEQEPPAENNSLIHSRLDNLIITPHIAWASIESRQRLINAVAQNILQHISDLAS